MDAPTDIYELRYRWNPRIVGAFVGCAAFVALGFIPGMPLWIAILDWAFFGLGMVLIASAPLRSTPILRADATGLLLGPVLADPRGTVVRMPWSEVGGLIHWAMENKKQHQCIAVLKADGSTELAGAGPEWIRHLSRALAGPLATASRPTAMATVDLPSLARVLERVAPNVALIDLTTTPPTTWRHGTTP